MAGAMVQLVLALYLATILSFKTKFGNMFKGFMFFPLSDQWYCHWIYLQILLHQRICIRYGITVVWI